MRALMRDLSKCAFFLDYDGTLCPHLEVWEGIAYNAQDIQESLNNLSKKSRSVFWNTGRRTESLESVYAPFMEHSGFFVQGSIYWDVAKKQSQSLGIGLPSELEKVLRNKISEHELAYRLEIKPTAARIASLHKTQRKYLRKFIDSLDIPLSPEWEWRIGDRGAELLQKKCSKGTALEYAYTHKLIPEDSIPVVAGDDWLDREAMEVALARGGFAILVGESCGWVTEIPHKSSQVLYFREPRDFLSFIRSV